MIQTDLFTPRLLTGSSMKSYPDSIRPAPGFPVSRDLAAQASVNPNTMQKAFTELERTGLIVTRRTSGRTVTEDTALIEQVRSELAELQISQFLTRMQHLGYQKDDSIRLLLAKKEENS